MHSACNVPPNSNRRSGGHKKKLLSIFSTFCIIRIMHHLCMCSIESDDRSSKYITYLCSYIELEVQSTKIPPEPILITEKMKAKKISMLRVD